MTAINNNSLRILIIRLSAIGDVLHATSVVHNLRIKYPKAHISWLVSPPADILLKNNPDIDELIIWDRRPTDKAVANFKILTALKFIRQAKMLLKKYHFDIVLDIQGLFLTGLLARFTDAPRRIGIHERHEGNFLFMTEMAPKPESSHKIKHYLTALAPLGIKKSDFAAGLILKLPPNHQDIAAQFWRAHNISLDKKKPLLMVNVLTTWEDKNYPPNKFAIALNALPKNIQIIFCGSKNDNATIKIVQGKMNRESLSIAGETSLIELAILLKTAALLLTSDTGPLYLAEAVGCRTLSLWGPTHPAIYGPLTGNNEFIISPHNCTACCKTHCQYKTNACMNAIEPLVIAAKLQELLDIKNP